MRVLISGASGLVGKALQKSLIDSGDEVICLVRDKNKVSTRTIYWDPSLGLIDISQLEGFDAIVNLSGENIAEGRWTEKQKDLILKSRLESTQTLANSIIRLKNPPKVFINGSAIGYYGDRGDEICNEDSSSGSGFLADVCRQWELAAAQVQESGIRTVFLRTGIVLSSQGGALTKMLPPFKLGVGGMLGSGQQYMSWIAIDDLVGAIIFTIHNESIKGPVNAVAPQAVNNAEFTKILGKVLGRPTFLAVPALVLRGLLGKEMADQILLSSTFAEPAKLKQCGYVFKYPNLEQVLKYLLEGGGKAMEKLQETKSEKSFIATLLFCLVLGTFGAHRFYVDKIGTGILMLLTLGGCGIWLIVDLILIVSMRFRDKQGYLIEP